VIELPARMPIDYVAPPLDDAPASPSDDAEGVA
jgi:hypothetical protein